MLNHSTLTLFLCLIIEATTVAQAPAVDFSRIVFTCSPCGDGSCDGKYTEKPGICQACNMDLIATYNGLLPANHERPSRTVAILLYPGVDVMDISGPYSVFGYSHLRIITVAKSGELLRASGGLMVKPAFSFQTFPGADIIVIPGGGPAESNQDPDLVNWIKQVTTTTPNVLSVCSGAFFLAKAGLLDNKSATTFASLIPQLQADAPRASVIDDKRIVDNDKIVTSAGLSSGIDGALHVVEKLYGSGFTQQVANQMEYNWDPEGKYVRAQLADKYSDHPMNAFALVTDSLVSHKGDRSTWTSVVQVRQLIPDDKLEALVDYNQKADPSWVKLESNGLNSRWAFKGDNNEHWDCRITASQVGGGTRQLRIEVKQSAK